MDTSTLIRIKRVVKLADQWQLLDDMRRLVQGGWLTFPVQVAKELAEVRYPDAPGAWVMAAKRDRRYPEPSDEELAEVLDVAEELVDPDSGFNYADPYVAALAYGLQERFPDTVVVVATEDVVDRQPLISLGTACDRLKIKHFEVDGFLKWLPSPGEA